MTLMKRIRPSEKVPLKLTPTETKAIFEGLMCLDRQYEQIIQKTPAGKPVMMTLDDVADFAGHVAAAAKRTEDKKLGRKLDKVCDKCQKLLDSYTDEPSDITPEHARQKRTKGMTDVSSGKEPATVSFRLTSKTPTSATFPVKITPLQQASLVRYTRLKAAIKRNLKAAGDDKQIIEFTKKELDQLQNEVGQAAYYAPSPHKQRLVAVQKKVDDILQEIQLEEFGIEPPKQRRRPSSTSDLLIQLKISLIDIRPTIWRRIRIKDCMLGDLHQHIQTAIGWENCHMHEFIIDGERYGPPVEDIFGFGDEINNESEVRLSDVLPKSGKRFRFQYVYDFGDEWRHEILFEGYPPLEKGVKYPVCVEGERAGPPEDVGGPWGYAEHLDALADPDHAQHEMLVEWLGSFDAEAFSVERTTKAMRKFAPK